MFSHCDSIIDAIKNGMSQTDAASLFNVARRTIYSWLVIQEKTGSLEPQTGFQKGHSHAIKDLEKFKKFVDEHADYTQDEMAEYFSVGHATIGRILKKIGYVRKKRITHTLNEMKKKIKEIDSSEIIYIDESGMNDNDFCPYAYAEIGKRYYESRPGHYKKRISVIGALCDQTFSAPFMFQGHCNTKTFDCYIENILAPTLESGKIIIIDNASFHKSQKINKLIKNAGCELIYLPPYSPDLNPIEHYWHKIKTVIRKKMRDIKITLEGAMCSVLAKMSSC